PQDPKKPNTSEPKKSQPTAEGIRMGKLVDCLESAKVDYFRVTKETRREYDQIFFSPVAVGVSVGSLFVNGVNSLIWGIAFRAAFGGAYHIGREIGNAQGYRHAVES